MQVKILTKYEDYISLVSEIEQQGETVFDLETNSLVTHASTTEIVGAGFCFNNTIAYYIPFNTETEITLEDLRPLLEGPVAIIGHNIKYDARVLNRYGITLSNITFDTMVASYCIHGDRCKHNLDDLVLDYFNHVKIRTNEVIPRKTKVQKNPSMKDSPVEMVAIYCSEDVFYTWKLYKAFKQVLAENENARNLFTTMEMPLLPVLIKMECNGSNIDKSKMLDLKTRLDTFITSKKEFVVKEIGRELKFTNRNDVAKALYEERRIQDRLGVTIPTTATGKYRTNKDTMERLKADPVVDALLTINKLQKLIGGYTDSLPDYISDVTGMIHCSFNQCITTTGRLSASDPNLQTIPKRDEVGKELREIFTSRFDGGRILAADLSQAEIRILAHITQEPVFLDVFRNNKDAHIEVASQLFNKASDAISPEERNASKTLNFG